MYELSKVGRDIEVYYMTIERFLIKFRYSWKTPFIINRLKIDFQNTDTFFAQIFTHLFTKQHG